MSEAVPQFDLRAQMQERSSEIAAAIARVLRSGHFILGSELEAFEAALADYCGVAHAVGVASGTDALELALRAAGIGPGDEVITVSHTFVATPLAVRAVGATPVFVDVAPEDGLMDPGLAAAAVGPRTRAIIPVHLYGRCVEMEPLLALAQVHGLVVIEDAAQAHGALWRGQRAGAIGDIGCFSFYPTKNLGALGDGGAVVTASDELDRRLRLVRNYGQSRKYHHDTYGRNSRLDELQAAVLTAKLPLLDAFNARRRSVASRYRDALSVGSDLLPLEADLNHDAVHQAVVRTADRDGLQRFLAARGIGTQIHYPVPAHRQAIFVELLHEPLPVTEQLAAEVLSLPMYPELTDQQVEHVCSALRDWGER